MVTGMDAAQMLDVANVWKSYGRSYALRDVSFSVPRGAKVLLLGPNGAGKSTMIKTILGLYKFKGTIKVDGFDVSRQGSKALERIGYVPQYSALYERLSVEDEAKLIAAIKGVSADAANEKLEMVGLGERLRKKSIRALSGGMRQRFAIAMALLTDPPFLVFDEPLASIDLRGQLGFLEFVRRLAAGGTTLLIATHLTGLGDIADKVVVLNRGRVVVVGTPTELMARINADETFYIKPKGGAEGQLTRLLEGESTLKVVDSGGGGKLLVVSIPPGSKVRLLKVLFEDGNGDLIEDISMDPSKIESSYNKLLQRTSSQPSQGDAARESEKS
jgi:ABC-2 type transport system ATP-binding protein